ncbi:MAG: DUF192 domain-containing protein [Phycisphaerales bacterium]|nr:DUF192 domain-containing protein [Phycisphaerales bacterium]
MAGERVNAQASGCSPGGASVCSHGWSDAATVAARSPWTPSPTTPKPRRGQGAYPARARRRAAATVLLSLFACLALPSCSDKAVSTNVESVQIAGRWFHLELALDEPTRMKGLGGREFIEPDGGMLFVFPTAAKRSFVMRDCPISIDIIFLDPSGRVVAMHHMEAEEPRREGESDWQYEERLKRYSSRFDSQFVIELAGNTLESLELETGDRIPLDTAGLKARAK